MISLDEIGLDLPHILDGEDKTSPLKNRIRKNYRHIRKWANRTKTNCFRIYNRDIKEYPIAIDFYAGRFCVYFFSYDYETSEPRFKNEVEESLISLFQVDPSSIYWKTRIKRAKTEQYEKLDEQNLFFPVLEYGVQFYVNLTDYLDTGLFLDHRETRKLVASKAKGKRVLNLFAYTCSFSVHAALQGAYSTLSVDLSNTYTSWGEENFHLNNLSLENNQILREDCLAFLEKDSLQKQFDLIIIDPPTISRSKKMDQLFDIQKDYVYLIERALKFLAPEGILFFSTNSRKFVLDPNELPNCTILEISDATIPLDFQNHKIHRSFQITL